MQSDINTSEWGDGSPLVTRPSYEAFEEIPVQSYGSRGYSGEVIMFTNQSGVICDWRGDIGESSYVYSPTCGSMIIPPMKNFPDGRGGTMRFMDYASYGIDSKMAVLSRHRSGEWLKTGAHVKFDCFHANKRWFAIRIQPHSKTIGILDPPLRLRVPSTTPLEMRVKAIVTSVNERIPRLILWNDSIGRISFSGDAMIHAEVFDTMECTVEFVPRVQATRVREDIPWKVTSGRVIASGTRVHDEWPAFETSDGWKVLHQASENNLVLVNDDRELDDRELIVHEDDIDERSIFHERVFKHRERLYRATYVKQIGEGEDFFRALIATPLDSRGNPTGIHPLNRANLVVPTN